MLIQHTRRPGPNFLAFLKINMTRHFVQALRKKRLGLVKLGCAPLLSLCLCAQLYLITWHCEGPSASNHDNILFLREARDPRLSV